MCRSQPVGCRVVRQDTSPHGAPFVASRWRLGTMPDHSTSQTYGLFDPCIPPQECRHVQILAVNNRGLAFLESAAVHRLELHLLRFLFAGRAWRSRSRGGRRWGGGGALPAHGRKQRTR